MIDMEALRANYRVVAAAFLDDGWSETDIEDMGAGIKRCIDAGDVDRLQSWHDWLKTEAQRIRRKN